LQVGLIAETSFPAEEGRDSPIEDKAVSLFPNRPRSYNEDFHEEIMGGLFFGIFHHRVKGQIKVPVDS
jgi:hypothetical protein